MKTANYLYKSMLTDFPVRQAQKRVNEAQKRVKEAQKVLHKAEEELRAAQMDDDALNKTFVYVTRRNGESHWRAPWGSLWFRKERELEKARDAARAQRKSVPPLTPT
jgi:multidrug resistance efflux pump